jgi:hypothetical protein
MKSMMSNDLKVFYVNVIVIMYLLSNAGCATNTTKIGVGMLGGAAMGGMIGNQFRADNVQEKTTNTIIS